MADTPKLTLPELSESQATKYITHNAALRKLDALVQCTVIDKDLAVAPGAPSDGDTYIVGATPSSADDWNGYDDYIAYYGNSAWEFHEPQEGWTAYVQDENKMYIYQGASAGWVVMWP